MKCKSILTALFFLITATPLFVHAQNTMPPPPLNNKVFDSMVGEWTGESNSMGMPMKETVSIRWGAGHQYLIMELKGVGKNNPEMSYEGLGVVGQDNKGNAMMWWFDSWGAANMATGTGTFTASKLEINTNNAMIKEARTWEVKDGVLYMNAKGTMMVSGQEKAYNETTIFTKKL